MRAAFFTLVMCALAAAATAAEDKAAVRKHIDIPAQRLETALQALAQERDLQVICRTEVVGNKRTAGASGELTRDEVLKRLLSGTGLTYRYIDAKTVSIQPIAGTSTTGSDSFADAQTARLVQVSPSAQASAESSATAAQEQIDEDSRGVPEILVKDSRILNMDIKRTRDDAQPYVIFERETIERSGAQNLEEFFKYRLTANTRGATAAQSAEVEGNMSRINLRGFGTSDTLILVDGRRLADVNFVGSEAQPDINGIPLAAVERIEVLPTTASGIYGGGATGGVINIILRRDYNGSQVKATYDNTFDSDAAIRRLDLSSGFSLEQGKTSVLIAGSYTDANVLSSGDRDFQREGRERVFANNPAAFILPISPPLARTANIRGFNINAPLQLKPQYGSTFLSAGFTYLPEGYNGPTPANLQALLDNAGSYNLEPPDTKQSPGGSSRALSSDPTVESATLTIRREFTPNLQLFLDGSVASNTGNYDMSHIGTAYAVSAGSPTNPFVQTVIVSAPLPAGDTVQQSKTTTRRVGAGAIYRLSPNWQLTANHTLSKSSFQFISPQMMDNGLTNAAILSGALNLLQDTELYPVDLSPYLSDGQSITRFESRLTESTVRLGGPVGSLPGGRPSLSLLLEHRRQVLGSGLNVSSLFTTYSPEQSYDVYSAYVETVLPLVSARNSRKGLRLLEVQLAGRHDRYRTNGANYVGDYPDGVIDHAHTETDSTNPTIGLRYQPVEDLMFRASYGTGFRPPLGTDLVPSATFGVRIVDPLRGGEEVILPAGAFVSGGNPDLNPEESTAWSTGAILTPRAVPGLRVSLDYSWIEKTNIIASHPGSSQGIVDDEALFPGRVERGARGVDDPIDWPGPIIGLDASLLNLAKARAEAFDLAADYSLTTSRGTLDLYAAATLQTHYVTQLLPYTPEEEQIGRDSSYLGGPLKFKANAGAAWTAGPWTFGWNMRYYGPYFVYPGIPEIGPQFDNVLSQGGPRVPSQAYHDVFAEYRLRAGNVFSDTKISLGIKNVLNTSPPFDAGNLSEYYSYYGDARLASYSLSITAGF